MKKRLPISNTSDSVLFLLKGAAKRRTMAMATAQMVQSDAGARKRLVSIK